MWGSAANQGEPDVFVCFPHHSFGLFVAIEVKEGAGEPTSLQLSRIRYWRRAGGIAFWTNNLHHVLPYIYQEIDIRTLEFEHAEPDRQEPRGYRIITR